MTKKVLKKYIKHMFKENKYDEISTTKKYDPLQRQTALCKAIAKDLKEEDILKIATVLSELFNMDWAAQIKRLEEEGIHAPFGYPDNGEWYFPTSRIYQNQEGNWFIEFEHVEK